VIRHFNNEITFNHHYDFKSFDTAMQLPCAICSLAYSYVEHPPSALSWVRTLGYYHCHSDEKLLRFYPDSEDGWVKGSNNLVLIPWSGESYFQH
jgi:hypothetical protein